MAPQDALGERLTIRIGTPVAPQDALGERLTIRIGPPVAPQDALEDVQILRITIRIGTPVAPQDALGERLTSHWTSSGAARRPGGCSGINSRRGLTRMGGGIPNTPKWLQKPYRRSIQIHGSQNGFKSLRVSVKLRVMPQEICTDAVMALSLYTFRY